MYKFRILKFRDISSNHIRRANVSKQQNVNKTCLNNSTSVHQFHTSGRCLLNPLLAVFIRPVSQFFAVVVGRGIRKWWQSLSKNKKFLIWKHIKNNKIKYTGCCLLNRVLFPPSYFSLTINLCSYTLSQPNLFLVIVAVFNLENEQTPSFPLPHCSSSTEVNVSCGVVGSFGFDYIESHFVASSYTQRKRFMLFDSAQLSELSEYQFKNDLAAFQAHLYPQNDPIVHRVKRIAQKLLHSNKNIPQIYSNNWTVYVINSLEENCQVYPSGQIVLYSGMLNLVDNDNQLAAILAHEISHVVMEHNAEKLSYVSLVDALVLVPMGVIWAFLPNDGIAAVAHWFFNRVVETCIKLPFSRTLEAEADKLGLFLAAGACFDVREASAFWGRLDLLEAKRNQKVDMKQNSFLSTHPSHKDRQSSLDQLMPSAVKIRDSQNCPRFGSIDPRTSVKVMQEMVKL